MATTTFTKLISLVAYDATLTERPDDFYLRAKTMPDTIDLHAVARETALRLGGKNEDEVYTLLNAAESVKCDALSSGYIVATPTALMQPCASGTVLKADLSKAPDRTKVKVYATLSMGPALRQSMEACQLEIFTQPAVVGPLLNGAVAATRTTADGATTRVPTRKEHHPHRTEPKTGRHRPRRRRNVHLRRDALKESVRPRRRRHHQRTQTPHLRPARHRHRRTMASKHLHTVRQRTNHRQEPANLRTGRTHRRRHSRRRRRR